MDRRAGPTVRILSKRADYDGESHAGQEPASERCADPRSDEQYVVPLHVVLPCSSRHQTRGQTCCGCCSVRGKGDCGMTPSNGIPKQVEKVLATHRRDFLKSAGLLLVSFATGTQANAQSGTAAAPGPYPDI